MLLFTSLSKIRKFSCSSTCFQGKEIVTLDSKRPEPEPLLSDGIESAKPVVKLKQELIPEKKKDQLGVNVCGIQMLSESLQKAVFPDSQDVKKEFRKVEKIKSHLRSHDLWGRKTDILPEADLVMPELQGKDIDAHFRKIAITQVEPYSKLLSDFISTELPTIPESWQFVEGWVRYGKDGTVAKVSYPQENMYVFDIEVCVSDGKYPTLAVALSDSAFYLWCSPRLVSGAGSFGMMEYTMDDLIPLETNQGKINKQVRLVIGHNVGFDRARVREQYLLERTRTKFLDTMSLHIAVSGITSYQRSFIMSQQAGKEPKKDNVIDRNSVTGWQQVSSKNGLSDVLNLYCNQKLDKEARNVFVEGTMKDIRDDFQNLATYCATDCVATYKVLKEVWPMYYERFPHPVTFAGMLEMGSSILPINSNWDRYIQSAETTFNESETILNHTLTRQANHAVQLDRNSKYSTDPWLWDLDWSKQEIRVKKTVVKKKKSADPNPVFQEQADIIAYESCDELVEGVDRSNFNTLLNSSNSLFKRNAFMPGYPQWYRELCSKDGAVYGPEDMSTSLLVVPKILKLTWQGYPLHYLKGFGWGYLVPGRDLEKCKSVSEAGEAFPLKTALKMFPPGLVGKECQPSEGDVSSEEYLQSLRAVSEGLIEGEDKKNLWDEYRATHELQPFSPKDFRTVTPDKPDFHTGIGPYDVGIPGCWFFRLPHKDSGNRNVGNPLSKDYLSNVSGGLLRSQVSGLAEKLLKINKGVSFWKMYRDRVMSQIVVRVDKKQLPKSVQESERFSPTKTYGAILPMTVVAGTLTRRAVEATWMTASNAYKDRIGSELKSMVQAPPGYHLVGADVDSQELWIASVIGDAAFAAEHGSTAFGWMTLQGKKSEGTDMHSRTAATVAISRDQAKILNYGRIYGAGEEFAKTLLKKFNASLTDEEAIEKARKMYASTKGVRALLLNDVGQSLLRAAGMNQNKPVSRAEIRTAKDIVRKRLKDDELDYHFYDILRKKNSELTRRVVWFGGTESHMFNKLEEIVEVQLPKTPVLECAITRALEPGNVGQSFMTSRVNWVVQSSAVDYLHLMLVSMRYLFDAYGIEGRFCISIHDEVRYLVKSEDRYRAALALHVTNLWTRAMFAHKLGMNNLPQSVAFFSSVDIDTVLRKEVNMDCVTPSNPLGLNKGYGIPFGESVDIYETIRKTGGNLKKVETDK